MKNCPLCHTTYEDWIDFCFNDGMPLVGKGGAASPLLMQSGSAPTAPTPRLADEADLPVAGNLRPTAPEVPVGAGDIAPARPAPLAPAGDITGVFVGPIRDEDGEVFRRLPAGPMNLASLSSAVPDIDPDGADDATRPIGSGTASEDSDEHSRATVPLTSSALAGTELPDMSGRPASATASGADALGVGPAEAPEAGAEPASADSSRPPAEDEPVAEAGQRGAEAAWSEPTQSDSVSEPDEDPPSGGGWGVRIALGGLLALVLVVGGVSLAAVLFMRDSAQPAAPPTTKPAAVQPAPPWPAPAPAPPSLPPVDPALALPPVGGVQPSPLAPPAVVPPPPAAGTPVANVAPPPAASPTARPPAATPVAARSAPPPAATPVSSSKPPATTRPASPPVSSEADPWGAPAPATSGILKIVTDPDGATVYINEAQRGRTPLSVQLPYGTQNIRIVRTGYKTEVRDVTLRVPEISVPFTLKPEVVTGTVNVYGPAAYRVVVDGHDRGAMPVTVQVSEGVRQFKLVSDADGSVCSLPREVTFRSPGRPETVTLACP
ncbi:MAG: PEGA domain-containing protein [Myxococcales bacterium]|nr:PEGA domain-containing protein [Myxococcales bacterium]